VSDQLILELAPPAPPSLDNFVAGANGAAVAGVRAAARGDERVVYLWGEAGCGKSHLLEAARRAAGDRVVTIDDVDALDAEGQARAFDAFNRARGDGASVVAAGNAPPLQLGLREDLRTRLGSGLVFQMHPLSDEQKAAALRAQAAERGIPLADDVAGYLLRRLPRSLGLQLAVLDALDRYSLAQKRTITLPLVREALAALGIR
jgi:DnaA family protein